tara:strand:- start:883 stop:2658 length:1776 start_codon:yes stop_codon:yes gene_type:complete
LIDLQTLSLDNLKTLPNVDFKTTKPQGGGAAQTGRLVAQNGEYRLYYVANYDGYLVSGAYISQVTGFLITKTAYTDKGNARVAMDALAFYPVTGIYSEVDDSFKETVVTAYNDTIEGDEAETTDDLEGEKSLNERGETVEEERARLDVEERTGLDGVVYDTVAEKDAADAEYLAKPIDEEKIIRDESVTLTYEGASITRVLSMRIIQITSGNVANPIVTYRVEQYNKSAGDFIAPIWSEEAETQEQAEFIFDNRIQTQTAEYEVEAEIDKQNVIANTPTLVDYENLNIYWEESPLTFQQTFQSGFDDMAALPFRNRVLGTGPYDDAASWSNGGNTLELDDFDAPRVTWEGVTANPSGAVGFTIAQNWRVTFELTTDSALTFIENNVVDGVSKSSNTFTFTMYAGDRLEIDIDNERDTIRPFLVMVQGREWTSIEEADDEISLTMVKAEKLMIDWEKGKRWELPDGTVREDLEGTVTGTYQGPAYGRNTTYTIEVVNELSSNPEYDEAQYVNRDILAIQPAAEKSFIGQDEVGEQIVDAGEGIVEGAADIAGTFFDRFKWWILGGVVVIGIFIYINARARSSASSAASGGSE